MSVLQRRAIATGTSTPAKGSLVNTATLVRGRVYIYKNEKFEIGVTRVVSDELADILEDITVETKDTDDETFAKPMFDIRRKVQPPKAPGDEGKAVRQATRLPVRLYRPRAG